MPYANASGQVVQVPNVVHFIDLSPIFLQAKLPVVKRGFPNRVVTTVFKPFQGRVHQRRSVSIFQNATEYSAHFWVSSLTVNRTESFPALISIFRRKIVLLKKPLSFGMAAAWSNFGNREGFS
jgi:hypothetical protein